MVLLPLLQVKFDFQDFSILSTSLSTHNVTDYIYKSIIVYMTRFIFVVCVLVCLASSVRAAVQPHPPVNRTHMPNEFVIDLDKSHEDRWRELAQVKHDDLMVLIDYLYATAPYKYVLPVQHNSFRWRTGCWIL